MLPVAVMQPTPPERMLSSRKTSLPANTSKPDFAKASSIALVFFQSPDESLTPATVLGNFFSNRSISGSVIGTCDTGGEGDYMWSSCAGPSPHIILHSSLLSAPSSI